MKAIKLLMLALAKIDLVLDSGCRIFYSVPAFPSINVFVCTSTISFPHDF
jgi:hypothetical protein